MSKAKLSPVVTPPVSPKPPPPEECGRCRHYKGPLGTVTAGELRLPPPAEPGDEFEYGGCTRFPPTIPGRIPTAHGPLTFYPLVLYNDRCGEFAPRNDS